MPSIDSFVFLLHFLLFLISWISMSFSFFWFPCKVKVLKFHTSCKRSSIKKKKGFWHDGKQLICSYMLIRCFFFVDSHFSWNMCFSSCICNFRESWFSILLFHPWESFFQGCSSKASLKKTYVFQNTIFMCRECVFLLIHIRLISLFDAIVCSYCNLWFNVEVLCKTLIMLLMCPLHFDGFE